MTLVAYKRSNGTKGEQGLDLSRLGGKGKSGKKGSPLSEGKNFGECEKLFSVRPNFSRGKRPRRNKAR